MKFKFMQVDVFSNRSCFGNPVCVFLESDGLQTQDMQRIARWTNLSETTFVSSSQSNTYSVRIFTPKNELPFAGHPTLGTAFALYQSGLISGNGFVQNCAFGAVSLEREDEVFYFELPHFEIMCTIPCEVIRSHQLPELSEPLLINTGPHWIVGAVAHTDQLEHIKIDQSQFLALCESVHAEGMTIYAVDSQKNVHVRTFFDAGNCVVEDPVCGSGNAAVGVHIRHTGRDALLGRTYEAYQGRSVQRDGQIFVDVRDKIRVGGMCNEVFSGDVNYKI